MAEERTWRPTDVFAVSQERALDMARNLTRPTIIISINDPGMPEIDFGGRPDLLDVCHLRFFDVDGASEYGITEEDAEEILDFVEEYADRPVQIIVHCYAGQSRSAGVAVALMELFGLDSSEIFDDWHYRPNKRCYEMVMEAALGEAANPGRRVFWEAIRTPRPRPRCQYRAPSPR